MPRATGSVPAIRAGRKSSDAFRAARPGTCIQQFVIRTSRRDELRGFLTQRGIRRKIYYPYPLHLQPRFPSWVARRAICRRPQTACKQVLALPISPMLTDEQQQRVGRDIAASSA